MRFALSVYLKHYGSKDCFITKYLKWHGTGKNEKCIDSFGNRYVIGTLELLVAENYMIVYLNGATSRRKMPSVGWLRKCYQQIDRR